MTHESLRDWQRYLQQLMGVDFSIDGGKRFVNLLKRHPIGDSLDNQDKLVCEFFSADEIDIDTLRGYLNDYPGSISFSDPFDDLSNWTTISGTPAIVAGKLNVKSGDEVSHDPTVDADKVTIKMQATVVSQTPACRFFVDASATTQILEILIDDSKLKYNNGSEHDIQAVANNTEYTIEIYFNFDTKKFSIVVDTVEKVSNAAFETNVEFIYLYRIKGESTGGQFGKFDDFKIEFVGSHPAVITPVEPIYKNKFDEKHWWTVEWEVWN